MMTPGDYAVVQGWFEKVPEWELRIHDDPFGRPGDSPRELTHLEDRPLWTILEFDERFVLLFAGAVRVQSSSPEELVLSGFSQVVVATQGYGNDRPGLEAYLYGSVYITPYPHFDQEAAKRWHIEHQHRPSGYGEVEAEG
jgi:hypothetical protein